LDRGADYWAKVLEDQLGNPQPTWRAYVDALHEALATRWLSGRELHRLLKTDLFEEAVGKGLRSVLQQSARVTVGMDVSWRLAGVACSRLENLHGIAADSRRLPFIHDAFDGIISISTLDHFDSSDGLQRSLLEIARVLRPGGILILTLDNVANPLIALRQHLPFTLLNRLRIVPYYIGYTCGPARLRDLLGEAGFDIAEMGAVVHCARVLAIPLARWLDRHGTIRGRARLGRILNQFESLAAWPTRFLTGHFIAVKAVRRDSENAILPGSRKEHG
jgi:SAM-dependent methyltransferase